MKSSDCRFVSWALFTAALAFCFPSSAAAQGTPADYQRAAGLQAKYEAAAIDIAGPATWIGNTHRFWYRKLSRGAYEFIVADADTLQKQPAFDHEKIAQSLSKAAGNSYTANKLPFTTIVFEESGSAFSTTVDGARYRCTVSDSACRKVEGGPPRLGVGMTVGRRPQQDGPRVSPDGKWEALINNFNVVIRAPGSHELQRLSLDGSEGNYYELSSIVWSPDSTKLAAYRVKPGYHREIHYIESSPEDQLQPELRSLAYAKPGDVLDLASTGFVRFDREEANQFEHSLFPNPFSLSELVWRKDSHAFTFEYNQRGHQVYRIIEVDAATGRSRAVISEEPKTFFNYRHATGGLADSGKEYRYDVDDGKEVIWMSERDGWNHLYLFDGVTGALKNQITKGDWVVRAVQRVDEATRQIWFSAGGMYPGKDPYFANYYRINFDGTGLTRLTPEDADYTGSYSHDGQFFVDIYSRIDLPPVVEVRRVSDNSVLATLEKGDMSGLLAAGWKAPEVFVAKGRDGKTDI